MHRRRIWRNWRCRAPIGPRALSTQNKTCKKSLSSNRCAQFPAEGPKGLRDRRLHPDPPKLRCRGHAHQPMLHVLRSWCCIRSHPLA